MLDEGFWGFASCRIDSAHQLRIEQLYSSAEWLKTGLCQ